MKDLKREGYFLVENILIDRDDLKPTECLLYMVLARYSDSTNLTSISEDKLCNKLGVKDKRTLRKHIKLLEEKKLIEVVRTSGSENKYVLSNRGDDV